MVDIGAHIGYYTLLLARQVGPNGKVFAFEPDPANFALLQRNVTVNNYRNVELYNLAVSDRTGPAELFRSADNAGDHRIWASTEARPAVEIQTVALDTFFTSGCHFDFVKMDIQGAEWSAVRGMQGHLRQHARLNLVTEFWPFGLRSCGGSAADYLALLEALGFRFYVIDESRRQLARVTAGGLLQAFEPQAEGFTNLLCIK